MELFMYLNHKAKHIRCCHIHFIFWGHLQTSITFILGLNNFTFIILVMDTLMVFLMLKRIRFGKLSANYISWFA